MQTYFEDKNITIYHGDCRKVMREFEDNCVDTIITDPPYGLTTAKRWSNDNKFSQNQSDVGRRFTSGFMGKKWDGSGIEYNVEMWHECLRILKPGGYLLAFGGTRTCHRLTCAIEDAGFEIRDMICWMYGSGFPKSLNVGKSLLKQIENELSKQGIDIGDIEWK